MRVESFVFGCGDFISLDDLEPREIDPAGMAMAPTGIAFKVGMFASRGQGDSMEPIFPNRYWGIFYPASTEPMGASCILIEDNSGSGQPSYALKKFSLTEKYNPDGTWDRTEILLLSRNEKYPPIPLSDYKNYRPVGWLVGCVPKIKRCDGLRCEPFDNT
jgi:hypothetical protein